MRALKRRLTALGDTCAEAPIAGRLIELATSEEGHADAARLGAASWSDASVDPPPSRGLRQIRPSWKFATGSATSALLAIGVIAFALGNVRAEPPAPKITPSVDSYLLQHSFDAGQQPAGGQTGSTHYWAHQVTPPRLDPSGPGLEQLGVLAEPAPSAGGSAGSIASVPASPAPVASASASPAAHTSTAPHLSPSKHPASRSTK